MTRTTPTRASASTRRAFLARGTSLVGGAAALALFRPAMVLAEPVADAHDLVDMAAGFDRGAARGIALAGGVLRATAAEGVFTSSPLQAPGRFTHVGLHWQAEVPASAGLDFEVRMSRDGSAWSAWAPVRVERARGETPADDDAFGGLVFARDARFVQYRATFRAGGGASPSLQRVTATVIDAPATATTADQNQLPAVTATDAAAGRSLAVTAREQWGSYESYRFTKRAQEVWPEMFVPAKKLVVHHTATRNDYATAAEAAAEVRAIYRYHAVTQRWGDIGYTALVDRFGNIYEGRHGRGEGDATLGQREVLSGGVVAGHDTSHNYGSAGVALLGDATRADWPLTTAGGTMWDALVRFSVFEAGRHGLNPAAASDFLRSDDTWTGAMQNVSGHRETNATTCPGDVVMGLLPNLRSAIHAGLADTSRTAVTFTTTPGTRQVAAGTTVTYAWAAEVPEPGWTVIGYEACFEGWYKPSRSYDIRYYSGYTSDSQPRQLWTRHGADYTRASFTPSRAGHYTLHVRAIVSNSLGERRAAYEANHTLLVK